MAGGQGPATKRPGHTSRTSWCIISQVLVDGFRLAAAGPVDAPERGVYTCSTGGIEVAIGQPRAAAGDKHAATHLRLCVKR
ncbi:MAG: hypothetical protein ACJ76O_09845 [Gaiellaceae bacterium]